MKIVKVRKVGSTLVMTLPSDVCKTAKISVGDYLELYPQGKGILVIPHSVNITGGTQ